jgi:hypothetical protein
MYAVVRSDLPAGSAACQAAHALRQYAEDFPFVEGQWWRSSNTLVILHHPDLEDLMSKAISEGITCTRFVEPDWHPEGVLTALALGPDAADLLSQLPLMR